jgi:hypothetical protein
MPKLCDMEGVRGGEPGFDVELHRDDKTSRIIVRGFNEGGFACVDIDLLDLLTWLGIDGADAAIAVAERRK